MKKKKSTKNLKFYHLINYAKVGKVLKKADLLLMPYQSKISINSKNFNDDIAKFISPLKMFEYLASGVPVISSNIKVLRETLIHNENCILVNNYENNNDWVKAIENIKKNFIIRKKIYFGALKTASNNTWKKRVKRIIYFYNKFYSK